MDLLISEELLLLALDEEKGGNAWLEAWQALPIAVVVDAIATRAVTVEDDHLRPGVEPDHPLLRRVRDAVAAESKPHSLQHWVAGLPTVLKPLIPSVAEQLVARGVLRQEPGRVLLFWNTTDLPEADPRPERALRARLRAVLVDGAGPSAHDTQLITLLHHDYGRIDAVFADEERDVRKAARARAAHIAEHAAEQPGARASVDAAEAAAVSATMTAVTAATMSTVVITSGGNS